MSVNAAQADLGLPEDCWMLKGHERMAHVPSSHDHWAVHSELRTPLMSKLT